MKNGSSTFDILTQNRTCAMCGASDRDFWQTQFARPISLSQHSRMGDTAAKWILCDECSEGLQNTSPPKPDRIHLLSQVRRATIDDQKAVLNWLLQKFNLAAAPQVKAADDVEK